MNYIRYDRNTGKILGYGSMSDELVQNEINAGRSILFASNLVDLDNWVVNLKTKELERTAPLPSAEEIPPNTFFIPD